MVKTINFNTVQKQYIIIRLLTFVRYFGDCLFYAYFYLFLKSKGLTEGKIGMITSITPLVALISNPFWNVMSKNANTNRTILRIITVLEGLFILLFTFCDGSNINILFLITALVALVGSPFYSLLDGFSETFAKAYQKDYTKIRFMGTFAYICASMFAAFILFITKENYDILLYFSGSIFILTTLFFIFLKPINLKEVKGSEEKRDYKAVLKNKTFWFYMLIYFLVISISSCSDSFISIYFTNYQGLSSSNWSIVYGAIILTEFITMFIISRKKKVNINILWLVVGLTYSLRSFVIFLDLPKELIIFFALLRGVSYGMLLATNLLAIGRICGLSNITAALFVIAIGTSIIQTISNFCFGTLIEIVGYPVFYGIISAIAFFGFVLNLIYQIYHKFEYPLYKKKEEALLTSFNHN